MADAAARAGRERLLRDAHAGCAAAWLCSVGIAPAAEGIAFAALAAASALRWRAVRDALTVGRARHALWLHAALVALMATGFAWSSTDRGFADAAPGRTSLAPILVVSAAAPVRVLLAAIALPGAWWLGVLALGRMGVPLPRGIEPDHVSRAFLGLEGLAAAGCGLVAAQAVGPRGRAAGALASAAAAAGALIAPSRTLLVVFPAAAGLATAAAAADRRSLLRRGAALLAAIAVTAAIIPFTPLAAKIADAARRASAAASAERDGAERAASYVDGFLSYRLDLYRWGLGHCTERLAFGHGAGSWPVDFERAVASGEVSTELSERTGAPDRRLRLHAHNMYLQMAYEHGLAGLGLLLALLASSAALAWQVRRAVGGTAALALLAIAALGGTADMALPSRGAYALLAATLALACAGAGTARDGTATIERP